jgi:hypothetical protein
MVLSIVGVEPDLHKIPPPLLLAMFPAIVQLIIVGVQLYSHPIPAPVPAVLFAIRQLTIVGLELPPQYMLPPPE